MRISVTCPTVVEKWHFKLLLPTFPIVEMVSFVSLCSHVPLWTVKANAKKRNIMKYTCITLSGGLNNTRCNIILLERRGKKNCCRVWILAVDRTGTSLGGCLLLLSKQALSSHSDGLSGISEYSWASLKSALLFLEGIHQNSVNFDNPPLSSPPVCDGRSGRRGEEGYI